MTEENMNVEEVTEDTEVAADDVAVKDDKKKKTAKKVSFGDKLKNFGGKIKKFFRDTVNEMKKVHWTPKDELKKSTILVVVAVVVTATGLALIDSLFAFIINQVKDWIGLLL